MPLIDGYDRGGLLQLFAQSPASFFKAWTGGPTNESGDDLGYFDRNGYRNTAAEASGQIAPIEAFIYADAKSRNFQPFGNFEGDWTFRNRVLRAYFDQPGSPNRGRATGLEQTVQNEAAGLAEYRDQQSHGSNPLSSLGLIAAVAGIITGGLSLVGSIAEAATTAGLVETAGVAAADAGFIGAGGATSLAGVESGLSLASAAGIVKNAYGVASGVAKLTSSSSSTNPIPRSNFIGSPVMAATSPFYLVNNDTAASTQSAAPQTPGAATANPAAASSSMMGLSSTHIALIVAAAVAYYAFKD